MKSAPWVLRANGGHSEIDADEVRRALELFADPEGCCNLFRRPVFRGCAACLPGSEIESLVDEVRRIAEGAEAVWYGINPTRPGLTDKPKAADVTRRRWLLIDVDRAKTEGDGELSATEEEHEHARELATAAIAWLQDHGWPAPAIVDSGNGFQLLYRIDLPNDDVARALVRRVLKMLADKFDGDRGTIGKECHNADRLAKLPGTWARRGEQVIGRPHRMARLVDVPEDLGTVTQEQLTNLGKEPEPQPETSFRLRASSTTSHAYASAALRGWVGQLKLCTTGTRNTVLNQAAFRMGRMVGGGLILRQAVEADLHFTALQIGLPDEEARRTIKSGLDAGIQDPFQVPVNGKHKDKTKPEPPPGQSIVWASDIKPEPVNWLWPERVARQFIAVFAGQTALGKSFVVCDIVSRLTTGREIPEGRGECFKVGKALILSEDPHQQVLVPRLIELGADLTKVALMTWEAMAAYTLKDVGTLDKAYVEAGNPDLVVIDPPTNFLGDADEHKNSEIRQIVMKIVAWLTTKDTACIFILHVNKNVGKGVEALNRIMGSVAWVTTSRIAHTFCKDPEDHTRFLFAAAKSNLGPMPMALAFRIVSTETLARVEWLGEVDTTADEAMNKEKRKRRVVASEWLEGLFKDTHEIPSRTVWDAKKQTTLSDDALKEAKEDMGIRARRVTGPDGEQHWVWIWPPDARAKWRSKEQEGDDGSF